MLLKKGETQLALGMLQQALKRDSNNIMAHHLLGQTCRKLGRTAAAEQELRRAQELQAVPPGDR